MRTITIENISPMMARTLLENSHEKQRKLRNSHVAMLKREMMDRKWRLSNDSIVIAKGILCNGQHRLSALIEANMTLQFSVLRTDDDRIYEVLDNGMKRSIGNTLKTLDFISRNHTNIGACAQFVLDYQKGAIKVLGTSPDLRATRSEVIAFIKEKIILLDECVCFAMGLYTKYMIGIPPRLGASLLVLSQMKYAEPTVAKGRNFLFELYSGETEDRESAPWVLRERVRMTARANKMNQNYLWCLIVKGFNAYVHGKKLGVIKMVEGEKVPEL